MKTNYHFHASPSRWVMTLLAATAAVTLTVSTQAAPGGGGGQPTNPPLCLSFLEEPGDGIRSDGIGPYRNNSAQQVGVILSPGLDFDSNTGERGSGRTVVMDFSNSIHYDSEAIAPPPLPDTRFGSVNTDPNSGYPDDIRLLTQRVYEVADILPLLNVPKNHSRVHGTYININLNGDQWRLDFGSFGPVNDPHATMILITRLTDKAQGDACNSWVIQAPTTQVSHDLDANGVPHLNTNGDPLPLLDASGNPGVAHDVARLTKAARNPKNGNFIGYSEQPSSGHYHMPFAFIVTTDLTNQCP